MPAAHDLLRALRSVRGAFGGEAESSKRTLLEQLAARRGLTPTQLAAYHEDLLFLIAFPGEPETRTLAAAELARFVRRVRRLAATARARLDNSGIAGTVTRPALAWPVARALADEDLALDWGSVEDAEALDTLIARLASPAEREACDGGDYSAREWVALAKPRGRRDAAWLIDEAAAQRATPDLANAWDSAQVPLRWALCDSPRSVTHARLPLRRPVLRTGFRRLGEPTAVHVARPLPGIRQLGRREAASVVELARAALAARAREVHAMNYPNLDEVHHADLGEGAELVLIGVPVSERLTFEANYGYLLLSNGVPIGYGGVSPLFRQANTGINIFDPFRGSEAAFLWAQMLRSFRTLFGVRRFVINGYQFGAGNSEAIGSGAYWFYYRLGFRPSLADNVALAAQEAERLRREPKSRTQPAVLRRLARGDLYLDLADFEAADYFEEPLLTRAGAVLARRIAAGGFSSHRAGERELIDGVARSLGLTRRQRWSADERRGFERLAPYAALLDVARWPEGERRSLAAWLCSKGALTEVGFAAEATRQRRFFTGVRALASAEAQRDG